jgi:protease YdgD
LRLAAALALVIFAAAAAQAAALGADRRVPVDPNEPPWNAIAKVQSNVGEHCSGVLIAPAVVLTAAHCLYNPRTRALLQPVSLHVLFGYQRAQYRWHRPVARIVVGPGFDGTAGRPQPGDWARLELAEVVPMTPLPLFDGGVGAGLAVALAGYNQDRAQLLMADLGCHVLHIGALSGDATFVFHDCAATRGTSGAPLLTKRDGGWAVIAVNIAASRAENLALSARFGD